MAAIPNKALPTPSAGAKSFKSSIVRDADAMRIREQQRTFEAACRQYGEEAFSVDPSCAAPVEIAFSKELPQCPIVTYSLLSRSEVAAFDYLTARSATGFTVTIHNTDAEKKFEGSLLWTAVVRP